MRAVRSLLEGAVLAEKPHKHTQHARTHRDKVNRSRRVISSRSGRCWPRNHTHIHNTQHTTHNTQHTTHTHRGEINRSHRVSLSRSGRWWPRSSCLRTRSCPRLSRPVGTPSWLRQRYACGYMCMHTLCIYHRARTIAHMTSFGGQGTCMCRSNTRSSTESTDAPTLPWFSPAAATHSFTTAYSLAYHTAILLRPPLPLAGDGERSSAKVSPTTAAQVTPILVDLAETVGAGQHGL